MQRLRQFTHGCAAGRQRGLARSFACNDGAAVERLQGAVDLDAARLEFAREAHRATLGAGLKLDLSIGGTTADVGANVPAVVLPLARQRQVGGRLDLGPPQLRGARPPACVKVHLAVVNNAVAAPRNPGHIVKLEARQRNFIDGEAARLVRTCCRILGRQRTQRKLRHDRALQLGPVDLQAALPERRGVEVGGKLFNLQRLRLAGCGVFDHHQRRRQQLPVQRTDADRNAQLRFEFGGGAPGQFFVGRNQADNDDREQGENTQREPNAKPPLARMCHETSESIAMGVSLIAPARPPATTNRILAVGDRLIVKAVRPC